MKRFVGSAYDGQGIAPDVRVQPVVADLIGRSDSVLAAAVKRLQKR